MTDSRPGLGNGNVLVGGITRGSGIAPGDSGESRGLKGDGAETGEQLRPEGRCCVHGCACMGYGNQSENTKSAKIQINHHLYCLQDDGVERSSALGASPSPRDGTGGPLSCRHRLSSAQGAKQRLPSPPSLSLPTERGRCLRHTFLAPQPDSPCPPLLLGMQVKWLPNVFVGGAWLIKRQMSGNERASSRTSTFSLQQLHRHHRRRRIVTSHPIAHPGPTIQSFPTDGIVALATPDHPPPKPPPQPGHHRNGAHRRTDNAFRHLYCPEQQSPEGASPRWTGYNTADIN